MRKKIICAFFIFCLSAPFFCENLEASLAPPACVCRVQARVVSVTEKSFEGRDYLILELEIISLEEEVRGAEFSGSSCAEQYEKGMKIKSEVFKDRDFEGEVFLPQEADMISAFVEYVADEFGSGYHLSRIKKTGILVIEKSKG